MDCENGANAHWCAWRFFFRAEGPDICLAQPVRAGSRSPTNSIGPTARPFAGMLLAIMNKVAQREGKYRECGNATFNSTSPGIAWRLIIGFCQIAFHRTDCLLGGSANFTDEQSAVGMPRVPSSIATGLVQLKLIDRVLVGQTSRLSQGVK